MTRTQKKSLTSNLYKNLKFHYILFYLMKTKETQNLFFRKKVYTTMYTPTSFNSQKTKGTSLKKILPSPKMESVKKELKKMFLPLFIDIFELRQRIQNYKTTSPFSSRNEKSPKEILEHLTFLKNDIEEAQRWCEGIVLQIVKSVEEAKKVLNNPDDLPVPQKEKKRSLKEHIYNFFFKNNKA